LRKLIFNIEKLEKIKLIAYTEYKDNLLSKEEYLDKREKISNSIDKLTNEKEKLSADCISSEHFNQVNSIIAEYKSKKLTCKIIIAIRKIFNANQ